MERIKLSKQTLQLCFVCKKRIDLTNNKKFILIGYNKQNERIYRCTDCHIGSDKWLKSNVAKKSQFYNCYNLKEN